MEKIHLKFIDDMNAAESVHLKDKLVKNPETIPSRPFNFHESTQHIFPKENTKLQTLLDETETKMYADQQEIRVNHDKTKVMLFNTARNYDCTHCLSLGSDEPLELVEQVRLLGIRLEQTLAGGLTPQQSARKFIPGCGCYGEPNSVYY